LDGLENLRQNYKKLDKIFVFKKLQIPIEFFLKRRPPNIKCVNVLRNFMLVGY